jgi:NAD(P)-dependent dehydrogenase (short-subunit alcohol dehydrogenase family)
MDCRALKAPQCNGNVIITGATSGIGRIAAERLAGRTHRHRCAGSDERGPDGRRPKHVAAGGKLLVPALDDALCLGARRDVFTSAIV